MKTAQKIGWVAKGVGDVDPKARYEGMTEAERQAVEAKEKEERLARIAIAKEKAKKKLTEEDGHNLKWKTVYEGRSNRFRLPV